MARRSTATPRGGHYSITCDRCWISCNVFADSWEQAEGMAIRDGWRFVGHGMSARDYCSECAP